jgi:hypothetical protein
MPIEMNKSKVSGVTTLLDKLGYPIWNVDYAERQK